MILVPSALGWLAFLLFCGRVLRRSVRRLAAPLSLGVILMSLSTGAMAWILTVKLLPPTTWAQYVTIAPPLLVLAFDLGGALFMGLVSRVLEDEDREWLARASAWTQLFCVSWLGICGLVLLVPGWAFEWKTWAQSALTACGAAGGWLSTRGGTPPAGPAADKPGIGALFAEVRHQTRAGPFCAYPGNRPLGAHQLAAPRIRRPLPVQRHRMDAARVVGSRSTPRTHVVVLCDRRRRAALRLSWIMARYININKFSLHGMYRNRLIRAYLGASNPKRNASRFTGFAESDNLQMRDFHTTASNPFTSSIWRSMWSLANGSPGSSERRRPFPYRRSICGNHDLGYRDSARYGGPDGISLGTAVTISGAAASPSMGYHSSSIVGLIMTLLNARLGAWLGNPGVAGNHTWTEPGPRTAIGSLVKEAFGLTTNTNSYVYLSDGGHFENLASTTWCSAAAVTSWCSIPAATQTTLTKTWAMPCARSASI